MCCFSGTVTYVRGTNIFARVGAGNLQYLAYSMALGSAKDLAMILLLPVPSNTTEDGVQFINLHEYPTLFKDLEKLHPKPNKGNGATRGVTSLNGGLIGEYLPLEQINTHGQAILTPHEVRREALGWMRSVSLRRVANPVVNV